MPGDAAIETRRGGAADLLLNFLPGLLAGSQLTGLLLFLNPALEFGTLTLLRGTLLYGGLLGGASVLLLSPFTLRRAGRARRLLPWTLTAVLAVAAIGDWIHAASFTYFVPPGMNVRLIKAALWLSAAALASFFTALLHTMQSRPYSLRSCIFLGVVAVASVFILVERREAFKPPSKAPPLPSTVEKVPRPGLVVVGVEAATLDAILPLARQGRLPFFTQMIEQGTYARLATLSPVRAPSLWTTLATGLYPYRHGLVADRLYSAGFLSPGSELRLLPIGFDPAARRAPGLQPRQPDARARGAQAAWEILARLGLSVGVVGWPATHPAAAEIDFSFSESYFGGDYAKASARPPELVERGVLFRLAPEEIDPGFGEEVGGEVPHAVLRALAGDLWRESLTLFLIEQKRDVKAIFLLLPGLGDVSRRYFGSYSEVHFDGSQAPVHREAAQLVTAYYRRVDAILAQVRARTEQPHVLAVVSASGVDAPGGPRKLLGQLLGRPLRGVSADAPDGVLFLLGEGIRAGNFLEEAHLVDVMPTLLYGLKLPIAQDLDGRVLTAAYESAFLARNPLTFVPSYETLAPEEP